MAQPTQQKSGAATASRAGVIGIGHLGRPMAERLMASGWNVSVCDNQTAAVEALAAKGATACPTPADVAREADIILLVVRTAADVEEVVFGASGIAETASPETLVCIVSTIALEDLQKIAARAAAQSFAVVDTAIGGGAPTAENRTVAAMIGGTHEQFDRISGLFEVLCGDLIHVPGLGGGMRLKLIKNHISYLTMMVGLEAAMLARTADIDLPLVTRAIESTNLVKQFLYMYLDSGEFEPLPSDADQAAIATQKAMASLCRKDLAAARALAAAADVDLPIATAVERRSERLFRVPGFNSLSDEIE